MKSFYFDISLLLKEGKRLLRFTDLEVYISAFKENEAYCICSTVAHGNWTDLETMERLKIYQLLQIQLISEYM